MNKHFDIWSQTVILIAIGVTVAFIVLMIVQGCK